MQLVKTINPGRIAISSNLDQRLLLPPSEPSGLREHFRLPSCLSDSALFETKNWFLLRVEFPRTFITTSGDPSRKMDGRLTD